MHVCMYVCMYACINVCMYVYIGMYLALSPGCRVLPVMWPLGSVSSGSVPDSRGWGSDPTPDPWLFIWGCRARGALFEKFLLVMTCLLLKGHNRFHYFTNRNSTFEPLGIDYLGSPALGPTLGCDPQSLEPTGPKYPTMKYIVYMASRICKNDLLGDTHIRIYGFYTSNRKNDLSGNIYKYIYIDVHMASVL